LGPRACRSRGGCPPETQQRRRANTSKPSRSSLAASLQNESAMTTSSSPSEWSWLLASGAAIGSFAALVTDAVSAAIALALIPIAVIARNRG